MPTTLSAAEVLSSLHRNGFARMRLSSSAAAAELAWRLGPVLDVTQVRISDRPTYLAGAGAIPPHTDHPSVRWILWYCNQHDRAGGGATELIDTRSVIDCLPPEAAQQLERVQLRCPAAHGLDPVGMHPLYKAARRQMFYAPWLCAKERQAPLLEFERELARPQHRRRILLHAGEAVVIDNWRMLHRRDAIAPDSARWLTRYWIEDA